MTQTPLEPPRLERAEIGARTLRTDNWRRQPMINGAILLVFVVYATWAILVNENYFVEPYISPFYSPCLVTTCAEGAGWQFVPWVAWLTPSILIIGVPMGFRMTCYYYRKAYYRSIWQSPTACGVKEPHKKYTGETRFPLIIQNVHRYFFWVATLFNIILTWDAIIAFRDHEGNWGHMGLGTLVLLINAVLLWAYSLSCHACRHTFGGRLKHFSKAPVRYWMWTQITRLNAKHMEIAWVSLVWVGLTDLYIRLVASGTITDIRFF
ncbi:MAG: hypothetical protein GEV11_03855 [Streptosporangiales bacterium]|nr:hypothetical protein [Streptosporangiales bacterium]